jgi:probable rRNA maturation factor
MPVEVQSRRKKPTVAAFKVKQWVQCICEGMGYTRAGLSVLLTDDAQIQTLNAQWRGKDKPTDVLSFSQVEGYAVPGDGLFLGDVVISLDTAARQAEAYGASLEQEVARLLVHGVLHVLGYDHVHGGRQAAKMAREEKRLRRLLLKCGGFGTPS